MNSYCSLEATLHDVFWASDGPSLELPLLRDFLQTHPGRSLEIGCGSGRLLLPLLQEGFAVDGLELSPEMLDLCRQQSAHNGLILHEGNMDDWHAPQPYATLMVPAFTLQLSRDPVVALERFAAMLEDHGALYLSTFTHSRKSSASCPKTIGIPITKPCSTMANSRAFTRCIRSIAKSNFSIANIATKSTTSKANSPPPTSPANNFTGLPARNSKPTSRPLALPSKNKSPISNPPASPRPSPNPLDDRAEGVETGNPPFTHRFLRRE